MSKPARLTLSAAAAKAARMAEISSWLTPVTGMEGKGPIGDKSRNPSEGPRKGGTGKVHNWEISRKIVKSVNRKVFLAGGLNPDNVREAIKKVGPYAVDTNSGVKLKAGKKDYKKLNEFIRRAKKC